MRRSYQLHFFQSLDSTLCLLRLTCLGSKTIDELLHVGDRLLLTVVICLLLREALGACYFEYRIVSSIVADPLFLNMGDLVNYRIEKFPVV